MHPFVYSLTSYYHIREQQDIFGPQLWLPGCLATVFSQLYQMNPFTSRHALDLPCRNHKLLLYQCSPVTQHITMRPYIFLACIKPDSISFISLSLQLCCLIARREGPGFAWLLSTVQRL